MESGVPLEFTKAAREEAGNIPAYEPAETERRVDSSLIFSVDDEDTEEIDDAVGAISNMVAGHVTTKMTEMDKKVKIKLDRVISGENHVIEHFDGTEPVLAIPFKTTKGKFLIEMAIKG